MASLWEDRDALEKFVADLNKLIDWYDEKAKDASTNQFNRDSPKEDLHSQCPERDQALVVGDKWHAIELIYKVPKIGHYPQDKTA